MNTFATKKSRPTPSKFVLPAALVLSSVLASAGHTQDAGVQNSVVASAAAVADGRPWTMNAIEYGQSFKLTLFPDGTGSMEGAFLAPTPTWRPIKDGLCIKPSMVMSEHCVTLLVRRGGYDGVENGALYFELRR